MTCRRPLSPLRRLALFEKNEGRCHICGQKIQAGQKWDVEHPIPIALGGADDESNMRPAHEACHDGKTVEDVGRIAKAKRMKASHLGIRKPSTFRKPPPGVKYDWKLGRHVKEAT